jgi:hypothetical protein
MCLCVCDSGAWQWHMGGSIKALLRHYYGVYGMVQHRERARERARERREKERESGREGRDRGAHRCRGV